MPIDKSHKRMMKDIIDKIEELFSDTSVPKTQTKTELESIKEEVQSRIDII